MDYQSSLSRLQGIFLQNDFDGLLANKRQHAAYVEVGKCLNGSTISISFPGYKAGVGKPDYRVDLTKEGLTTALSHANIIVDLYNKCKYSGMNYLELRNTLIEQACEGISKPELLQKKLIYTPVSPSEGLKSEAKAAHGLKKYNADGNRFDLTLEELFVSIKWIVLQEDINYPMPRYLGRKMPFCRYVEALQVASGNGHTLQEVIQRALSHSRPILWSDMDYSFMNHIR